MTSDSDATKSLGGGARGTEPRRRADFGRYRILGELGHGGMGVVYSAEDVRLKRPVALKFLSFDRVGDEDSKTRFIREARAASSLDHPNLCTIYEIDDTPDGELFLAMALYEGETLNERIARGPLPLADALDLTIQAAQGLRKAHESGIIHRDIKPSNLLVTRDGVLKVLDFGLAKLSGQTELTRTGVTLGTAAHMSPEQIRGEAVDARTDLWSLGTVLYEMLTGQHAFAGDNPLTVIHTVLEDAPRPLGDLRPGLPPPLEDIVAKALEKDPAERYQTMGDLVVDLRRVQRQSGRQTRAGLEERSRSARPRWTRRSMGILAAVVLLCAAVAGGITWSLRSGVKTGTGVAQAPVTLKSIAVLPFADLSPDRDGDVFADGVTDELITALWRIRDLQVTGRASSFYFKGNQDLRTVGERLGVEYLLTGSVRKVRDRLRVTAELVKAATGFVLWSEPFDDRPLADIVDVQDEIARRVAAALEVSLGVGARRTSNVAAYEEWLQANALFYKNQREYVEPALAHARRAIQHDPSYMPPRYLLYMIDRNRGAVFFQERADEYMRDAAAALDEARRLAPDDPLVRFWHAWDETLHGNWMASGALLNDLPTEPATSDTISFEGRFLLGVGRAKEAVRAFEEAKKRDPYNLTVLSWLPTAYNVVGNLEASLEDLDRYGSLGGSEGIVRGQRFMMALESRDRQRIVDIVVGAPEGSLNKRVGQFLDNPKAALAEIRRLTAMGPGISPGDSANLAFWSAYLGDEQLALDLLPRAMNFGNFSLPWAPIFRDARRQPGFKDFARKAGYVDYWRTYRWGDFCHPTTGDDFECS